MDDRTRIEIQQLSNVIMPKQYLIYNKEVGEARCPGGGSGNSFNDAIERSGVGVYGYRHEHSRKEREKSAERLRQIAESSSDADVRKEIMKQFALTKELEGRLQERFEETWVSNGEAPTSESDQREGLGCLIIGLGIVGYIIYRISN